MTSFNKFYDSALFKFTYGYDELEFVSLEIYFRSLDVNLLYLDLAVHIMSPTNICNYLIWYYKLWSAVSASILVYKANRKLQYTGHIFHSFLLIN